MFGVVGILNEAWKDIFGVRQTQTADLQTVDLQTCRPADLQTCRLADTFGTHGEGGGDNSHRRFNLEEAL